MITVNHTDLHLFCQLALPFFRFFSVFIKNIHYFVHNFLHMRQSGPKSV